MCNLEDQETVYNMTEWGEGKGRVRVWGRNLSRHSGKGEGDDTGDGTDMMEGSGKRKFRQLIRDEESLDEGGRTCYLRKWSTYQAAACSWSQVRKGRWQATGRCLE